MIFYFLFSKLSSSLFLKSFFSMNCKGSPVVLSFFMRPLPLVFDSRLVETIFCTRWRVRFCTRGRANQNLVSSFSVEYSTTPLCFATNHRYTFFTLIRVLKLTPTSKIRSVSWSSHGFKFVETGVSQSILKLKMTHPWRCCLFYRCVGQYGQ